MARLYGRAGRLAAKNGGFRPGQWANDWPRKKPGAVPPPAGAKEFMQISVPLVMLVAAKGMAASLG